MPHSEIKIGVRHLSFIGIVADLDGRALKNLHTIAI